MSDELGALAGTEPDTSMPATKGPGPRRPEIAQRVNRYIVLEALGQGGMGVVHAAYDPDLDRKVALKFVLPEAGSGAPRLLREAQTMAQLSHANVATCFDVGIVDDQVFLAMEYVEGTTMRTFVAEASQRPWSETWPVLRSAARGLAAAHDQGIVHRDFKPENVLIDVDGRVKVTDFGLARASHGRDTNDDPPNSTEPGSRGPRAVELPLTETGAVMGTPRYMPIEQHAGEVVDAQADQFAFCVTLYEALYGEYPFPGDTRAELVAALTDFSLREPPAGTHVPSWRRECVSRGLRPDPAERWPSMDALIEALDHDPFAEARARRRRIAAVGAFVGLGGVAAFGLLRPPAQKSSAAAPCDGAQARVDETWGDARRSAVREALGNIDRAWAAEAADRVVAGLTAYTEEWTRRHRAACVATRERGEQSDEALDLRMQCLDERLSRVDALASALADDADATTLHKAPGSVAALPDLDLCDDVDALRSVRPPGTERARAGVHAIRERLSRALAARDTGRAAEARESLETLLDEAKAIGHDATTATVLAHLGAQRMAAGDLAEAEEALRRALVLAAVARDDRRSALVSLDLVEVTKKARAEQAPDLLTYAAAAVARAGAPPRLRARLAATRGLVAFERGRYEEAQRHVEEAAALFEKIHGPDHPDVADAIYDIAVSAYRQADFETAEAAGQRSLEIYERAYGPYHPDNANLHNAIGMFAFERRDLEAAQAAYERSIAVAIAAHGAEDHPLVADAEVNLGHVETVRGDHDAALKHYRRALEIRLGRFGPDHVTVAAAHDGVAIALARQGKLSEAIEESLRAIAVMERAKGPEHPMLATYLGNAASDLVELERFAEAEPLLERAKAIQLREHGPDHPAVANTLVVQAMLFNATDRADEARASAERALEIRKQHDTPPALLALAGRELAYALWSLNEIELAGETAKAAIENYESAGNKEAAQELRARVDANSP